jgi:DNA polymerase III alpha subunit
MKIDFDVDIDMADREQFLQLVPHVSASIRHDDGTYSKHNTGIYFQTMPQFPLEQYSSLDYKTAEQDGWFKVDFLNNSVYKQVESEAHLDRLLNTEPMWELLKHKEVVEQLFHINNYHHVVAQYQPNSVEQLAMLLAVIRPGKRHLLGKGWEEIAAEVWTKPTDDSYYFKHSHAVAYALVIVVQLNLLCDATAKLDA